MEDCNALVKDNRQVARDTYLMTLACELSPFTPGRVLMLRLTGSCEPFLRRPLAVLSYREVVELLYKVKGRGTSLLAGKQKGRSSPHSGLWEKASATRGRMRKPCISQAGPGYPPSWLWPNGSGEDT